MKIKCLACDGKGSEGYSKEICGICNGTGMVDSIEIVKEAKVETKIKKKK